MCCYFDKKMGNIKRQLNSRIPKELWEEFSIRAIKEGKGKTALLIEALKEFLKKK